MFEVFNVMTGATIGYVETEKDAWRVVEDRGNIGEALDYCSTDKATDTCMHSWLGACSECYVSA